MDTWSYNYNITRVFFFVLHCSKMCNGYTRLLNVYLRTPFPIVAVCSTSLQKDLVLCVSINKQLRSFQNCFGLLSRHAWERVKRGFLISNVSLRVTKRYVARELRVAPVFSNSLVAAVRFRHTR